MTDREEYRNSRRDYYTGDRRDIDDQRNHKSTHRDKGRHREDGHRHRSRSPGDRRRDNRQHRRSRSRSIERRNGEKKRKLDEKAEDAGTDVGSRWPAATNDNIAATGEFQGSGNDIALDAELTPEEIQMMMAMGIPFGFDTTQGKHVDDDRANAGAVRSQTKRTARQYMNRKGGFNRPLPAERTGQKVNNVA